MSSERNMETGASDSAARYKYQRLRERLRAAIEGGELSGKLPGERELGRRYHANAKTVNKALSDLTTEGVLVRYVGRGTFVANGHTSPVGARSKVLRIGWLGPGNGSCPADHQGCYIRSERIISGKGHRIRKLHPPDGSSGRLPDGVLPPGELRDLDGIMVCALTPSIHLLADLYRRHLPVVIANNCHDQVKTPTVVADYAQGAFELSEHLIRLGHRDVQLLISSALLPAAKAAENGYLAAVRRYGLRVRETHCPDQGFDWSKVLSGGARPSGLVCVGAKLAAEASTRAVNAGLTTPSMLSITALPKPGETGLEEKPITTYEVAPDRVLQWATELLITAHPGEPPRTVIVPGELKDRGSAAPPASSGTIACDSPAEATI